MNASTTWNLDCGANVSFEITPELLQQLHSHPQVIEHLLKIGLKNVVQDSHASVVRKDFNSDDEWIAAKREKASLKLGALMTGELRAGSGVRQPKLSDREAFARKWLVAKLKVLFVAKHGRDSWKERTEGDSGAEFISGLVEKFAEKFADDIEAAWQLEIAEKAKQAKIAAEVDFDI